MRLATRSVFFVFSGEGRRPGRLRPVFPQMSASMSSHLASMPNPTPRLVGVDFCGGCGCVHCRRGAPARSGTRFGVRQPAPTPAAQPLVARRGSAPGEQWVCVVRPSCAARGTCPWTLRVGLLAGHPRGAGSAARGQGVPHQSRRPEEAVRFATLGGVRGPSGLEPACLGPPPAAHVRRDRWFARTLRLAHRGDRLLLLAEFAGRLRW